MKPRTIQYEREFSHFSPEGDRGGKPVIMEEDEAEAVRLVDYLGMNQQEAADSMGISRGTVWRCVDGGRRKLATMVVEGRPLVIGRAAPPSEGDD